jgi:hypothetical protein
MPSSPWRSASSAITKMWRTSAGRCRSCTTWQVSSHVLQEAEQSRACSRGTGGAVAQLWIRLDASA